MLLCQSAAGLPRATPAQLKPAPAAEVPRPEAPALWRLEKLEPLLTSPWLDCHAAAELPFCIPPWLNPADPMFLLLLILSIPKSLSKLKSMFWNPYLEWIGKLHVS